ncbi:uncharacterized protein LOC107808020 [Nicotiana tabacum]|uniref:Uncharacterized protein LOC107808020 n=1 Tax=Nicotiana tabacum TaxID=4097 RepID=A0A1S4BGJ8_TOBAC|nr:PREDICTED: uncharacterized protein LOC107808020 [Nicotiana tabacum]
MDRYVQNFLNKLSLAFLIIASLLLFLLFIKTPETCVNPNLTKPKPHHRFPKSTCHFSHRSKTSIKKHNRRLWSTKAWIQTVQSFKDQFQTLQAKNLFSKHSRALVVSAGPGHAVMALKEMGLHDVTGAELVDSPPLVSRADPHNLPFFDNAFDLGFSVYLDRALFPDRYVREMERAVRVGGACVVAVEECGGEVVEEVVKLFRKSKVLGVRNVTMGGEKRTRIVMRVTSD